MCKRIENAFTTWAQHLQDIEMLGLDESLKLYKQCRIEFPRLISAFMTHRLTLYRARIISKDSKANISNPKTFSYPPPEKCTTYQRASVPGFPVFYAAMDGKTALEELRNFANEPIKKGDQIYLSEWRTKEHAMYSLNYLTLTNIIGDEYLYSDITQNINKEFKRIFKGQTRAFRNKQRHLFDKVSNIFLNGKNYLQSGIIAYEIMYATPNIQGIKIDGIMYPSCSNNFRSVNCALLPEFVDKALELKSVRKVSFEEFTNDGANSTIKYFGVPKNDKVIWKTYVSVLQYANYNFNMWITLKWPDEKIFSSRFYLNNQEIEFNEFCKSMIKKIDLSNYRIPSDLEGVYNENGSYVLNVMHKFKDNQCYFEYNGDRNDLSVLQLQPKILARTKRISYKKVLNQ